MKILAITTDYEFPCEIEAIELMLRSGIDTVHLRKTSWNYDKTARFISCISEDLHPRIRLHDHFELLDQFNLAGVHLNSRNPVPPEGISSVSRSCHSLKEVEEYSHLEYVTLSPIFNSISKTNYPAQFSGENLKRAASNANVVALGGVMPVHFNSLFKAGFYGAAMLGWLWPSLTSGKAHFFIELKSRLKRINNELKMNRLCYNS